MPNLHELNLVDTTLTDDALEVLNSLPALEILSLKCPPVTDEQLVKLKSPTLMTLSVNGVSLSNQGLASLKHLTNLRSVVLTGTRIDDAGLEHLAACPKLQLADLRNTRVTPKGVSGLAVSKPDLNCQIGPLKRR